MRRALFMADQDVLYLVLLVKRVVNVERSAARVAENVFDSLVLQTTDKNLGAGQFHGCLKAGTQWRPCWLG